MATSSFKSTTRRSGSGTDPPRTKAAPPSAAARRRSHSVAATSRHRNLGDAVSVTSPKFSNKRDNPLFWGEESSSNSPPGPEPEPGKLKSNQKSSVIDQRFSSSFSGRSGGNSSGTSEHRGRSVTRNAGGGAAKTGIGRSVSRARGRSESRGHYGGGVYESEGESVLSRNFRSRNGIRKINNDVKNSSSFRNGADTWGLVKNARGRITQSQATELSEDDSACSLQIPNLEDEISTGSLSEGEERAIKAIREKMKKGDSAATGIYETVRSEVRRAICDIQDDLASAFQRNNANAIPASNVTDVPSEQVNPFGGELISDITREYAMELEESEERARKLRADLAAEEHRRQELGRILKDILPDSKTSSAKGSHRGRKTSSERRRMSKRLTEEAFAYFDECVSLSTFDSSDFSASEDPLHSSVGASTPIMGTSSLLKENGTTPFSNEQGSEFYQKEMSGRHGKRLDNYEGSGLTANISNCGLRNTSQYQFSFAQEQSENVGPQQDIQSYIKHFERDINKDVNSKGTSSYYDSREYELRASMETLLFDRVFFNDRIESGSFLLCGGAISFSPFASMI